MSPTTDDEIEYRIALISPVNRGVLAVRSAGTFGLPIVAVNARRRPAFELTRAICERWNIKSLVLDLLPASPQSRHCAVLEVLDTNWQFQDEGLSAVPVETFGDDWLGEEERTALSSILDGGDAGRGSFARIGWLVGAKTWIQESVADRLIEYSGEVEQLNGGGEFCLLRLGTRSGPAYWLKAVGHPNEREFSVTAYLAQRCPEYLPKIVAFRGDWRCWIMEEFGTSLHGSQSSVDFERAAGRLASLQRRLTGSSQELLDAGCLDHRLSALRANVRRVFEHIEWAMEQQITTSVVKLSSARLLQIEGCLHEAFTRLDRLGIADSFVHGDMSPGSILSDGSSVVFTDLCEAYVGNPVIAFEQMCRHVARQSTQPEALIESMKAMYKNGWQGILTDHQADGAFQAVPLVSVYSYLYGSVDWIESACRPDIFFQAHLRSLARHMDRIVAVEEATEVVWPTG